MFGLVDQLLLKQDDKCFVHRCIQLIPRYRQESESLDLIFQTSPSSLAVMQDTKPGINDLLCRSWESQSLLTLLLSLVWDVKSCP